jgi:hypothetical protein
VRPLREFHEREAARTSGFPVDRQHNLGRRRYRAEMGAEISLRRGVRQIADEQPDSQFNSLLV